MINTLSAWSAATPQLRPFDVAILKAQGFLAVGSHGTAVKLLYEAQLKALRPTEQVTAAQYLGEALLQDKKFNGKRAPMAHV